MKVWLTPNQALEQREPIGAEPGMVVPIAYRRVGALEGASPQEVRQAVRWAVRAYARDPSARNGLRGRTCDRSIAPAADALAVIRRLRREKKTQGGRTRRPPARDVFWVITRVLCRS